MLFIGKFSFAQEGGNSLKNFRFGMYGQPSIAWYKSDKTPQMVSDGSALKFSYGLATEFTLNKVASFSTGVEASYLGGKLKIVDDSVFYYYNTGNKDTFMLQTRNYRVSYVTIPITLKLKTPEIGAFTYFGQFGINLSIKTKAKSISDGGFTIKNKIYSEAEPRKDVDITKDMALFNLGLNIGAGFEYNLIGTTSAVVSVNYHKGFTNALKATSKELHLKSGNSYNAYTQNAKSDYVSLTLGILF